MGTVLIFGAGASKEAGAPLMSNFLDEARRLHDSGKTLNPAAFEDVFQAESELQSVFAKSYLALDNIDTCSLWGQLARPKSIDFEYSILTRTTRSSRDSTQSSDR